MRVPIDWLKTFVPIRWPAKELARRLTLAGLETASVDEDTLEVSVTPNRGDALSVAGVAREVAALAGRRLAVPEIVPPKGSGKISGQLSVRVADRRGCPRYMARLIRGVKIKPSPPWLQRRLEQIGLRAIHNVVDATNYVMAELGHPLHAFDARRLRDAQIVVRGAKDRSPFTTLDGEKRLCEPEDMLICDGAGPIALAGIMGGANSEVNEQTEEVVIEAAAFDPRRIHATAKRLKLVTESSYRFERGVDPEGVARALHRVVGLIVEIAGGTPTQDWVDIYPEKRRPKRLTLTASEVERILGKKIPGPNIKRTLQTLGFTCRGDGQRWQVTAPTFRFDISRPIDLIEEVARHVGYERLPAASPRVRIVPTVVPPGRSEIKQGVELLLGLGFHETCHLAFVSEVEAKQFAGDPERIVGLNNPLSSDQAFLRPSLLPGLLKGLAFNTRRQVPGLKLFEMGKVFKWEEGGVKESVHLGLAGFGEEWRSQWQLPKKPFDFFSLKGAVAQLTCFLNLDNWTLDDLALPAFCLKGMGGWVMREGVKLGWMGRIEPDCLKPWEIETPVFAAELDWEKFCRPRSEQAFLSRVKFPAVERDLALMAERDLPARRIEETIAHAGVPWLQKVWLFDCYQGEGLAGKKSLAFHIQYASNERTLTNEEVNAAHEQLVRHLEASLPVKLR